jgi:hypothetical protein
MLVLWIAVLVLTSICFILLRISAELAEEKKTANKLKRKVILLLSVSVILWSIWCAIREYWRPINISEHWLSTFLAFSCLVLALTASIQAFSSVINLRLSIGFLCLFISLIYLLGIVLSIPVS